jgi:hypothetical protein
MEVDPATAEHDERKGLRRFSAGAAVGLVGGGVGLVLPVSVYLLVFYQAIGLPRAGTTLIQFTTVFVLGGALLFALSLVLYRFGFMALQKEDSWFYAASVLCLVGTIGLLLIVIAAGLALESTPSLMQCIQGTPTLALTCLQAVQPLTAYSVVVGFWLAWFGALGIVVGLGLGGRRYRGVRIGAGSAAYAVLLLVLIDPFVALLFPISGWQYPLLTVPILALVAPLLVYLGCRRVLQDATPPASIGPAAT